MPVDVTGTNGTFGLPEKLNGDAPPAPKTSPSGTLISPPVNVSGSAIATIDVEASSGAAMSPVSGAEPAVAPAPESGTRFVKPNGGADAVANAGTKDGPVIKLSARADAAIGDNGTAMRS